MDLHPNYGLNIECNESHDACQALCRRASGCNASICELAPYNKVNNIEKYVLLLKGVANMENMYNLHNIIMIQYTT